MLLFSSEVKDDISNVTVQITELETAVETAIGSEDFDTADAEQAKLDAANVRVLCFPVHLRCELQLTVVC